MSTILGIDPGSRITGYGIITSTKGQFTLVAQGIIKTGQASTSEKLHIIFTGLVDIIQQHQPTIVSIEKVFFAKNAQSALKLGQARGAALTAAAHCQCEVAEYAAKEIKQAVVGSGAATKAQIQHMIKILLKIPKAPSPDAADALAAAICHCHHSEVLAKLSQAKVTAGDGA
jgi:crossover junction endodeoxyribonuclease RuvC